MISRRNQTIAVEAVTTVTEDIVKEHAAEAGGLHYE